MTVPNAIVVSEYSRPTKTFVWTNSDEGTLQGPDNLVDITGYSFQLRVRRTPIENTGLGTKLLVDLAGTIVTAAEGTFKFDLTAAHTGLPPGSYPGELLTWTSGATTNPPHYQKAITYTVARALKRPDE